MRMNEPERGCYAHGYAPAAGELLLLEREDEGWTFHADACFRSQTGYLTNLEVSQENFLPMAREVRLQPAPTPAASAQTDSER